MWICLHVAWDEERRRSEALDAGAQVAERRLQAARRQGDEDDAAPALCAICVTSSPTMTFIVFIDFY